MRTMAIVRQQRAMGWHTNQLAGPRQGLVEEDRNRDAWRSFRTALHRVVHLIARRLRKVTS